METTQLKAKVYDLLVTIETYQVNIRKIQEEIQQISAEIAKMEQEQK